MSITSQHVSIVEDTPIDQGLLIGPRPSRPRHHHHDLGGSTTRRLRGWDEFERMRVRPARQHLAGWGWVAAEMGDPASPESEIGQKLQSGLAVGPLALSFSRPLRNNDAFD
jgi:hypothetical protein